MEALWFHNVAATYARRILGAAKTHADGLRRLARGGQNERLMWHKMIVQGQGRSGGSIV